MTSTSVVVAASLACTSAELLGSFRAVVLYESTAFAGTPGKGAEHVVVGLIPSGCDEHCCSELGDNAIVHLRTSHELVTECFAFPMSTVSTFTAFVLQGETCKAVASEVLLSDAHDRRSDDVRFTILNDNGILFEEIVLEVVRREDERMRDFVDANEDPLGKSHWVLRSEILLKML